MIRGAFRRLAKVYHPDVPQTGDIGKFQELQRAAQKLITGQAPAPAWDAGSLEYLGRCGSQEVAVFGDPKCTQEPFYADFHACLCFTGTEATICGTSALRAGGLRRHTQWTGGWGTSVGWTEALVIQRRD
eukprot:symbB.v1.2.032486.t1/scaffold3905.1/size48494/1